MTNRQAGRRRGRGGGQRSPNNRDSGNRIDSRNRGNAAQLLEKYKNMARDAQMAGDRVNAEYYLQFADHYFRVLADNRARQEEQQANQPQRHRRPDENFDEDGDDFDGVADGVDEFRTDSASYDRTPREQPDRGQRDYNDRAPRDQDRAPRDNDRAARDQGDRPQRDQNRRQDESRDNREDRGREDRGREDRGPRRDRPRRDRPVFAEAQPQVEQPAPAPVAAPVVEAAPVQQAPAPQSEEAPRPRRGRPRKIVEPAAAEAAEGLDMAILPPSIARADNDSEASEEAPKKRTRRPRATTTQAAE